MKVRMIHSVGEHVAGTEVDLPDEEADRFVLLGYAETDGDISRAYSDEEREAILATNQAVTI